MLRNLWQWHQISLQGLHENFQRQSIPPTTLHSQYHLSPSLSTEQDLTYLNVMTFGWLSRLRFLISVSLTSLTFLTATSSPFSLPRKTAPWAPLPNHCKSVIFSKGISQSSETLIKFDSNSQLSMHFNCCHTSTCIILWVLVFFFFSSGCKKEEDLMHFYCL